MSRTTDNARSQHAFNVAAASIAVFLLIMAFLVWRLSIGVDPVIGSPIAQSTPQGVVQRKLVVNRKIIKIVRDRPALPPKTVSSAPATSSGSGTSSYSAPAAAPSYSAPAQVQSTPAPAPAPAPAPTTSAS